MKTAIKYQLSQLGILPHLDSFRRRAETTRWIANGCKGVAPQPVKRKILLSYLRNFGLKCFIETGTHLGDTLAYVAHDKAIQCTSIELADEFYWRVRERFSDYLNVQLLHGDSGIHLPQVISKLNVPALFWLDGHYSGGETARGDMDTPVSAELQAILESSITTHVILIDDARCFDGTKGYPTLDKLLKTVRENSNYCYEVSTDIIRLTPNC